MTQKQRVIAATVGGLVLIMLAVDFANFKPSSSSGPADVARLKQDGYTNIKVGYNPQTQFGCSHYAVGEDSNGDGYGELVIHCPNSADANNQAVSFNAGGPGVDSYARVDGDLVIVNGPLNGL